MGPTINSQPLIIKGSRAISPFVLTKKQAVASAAACFFMKGLEKTDGAAGSERPVDGYADPITIRACYTLF